MSNLHQRPPVVLVAEDEVLVRTCVVIQLQDAGCDVIEAGDAAEALREFETHGDITTVFTDVNMPGPFDGLSLLHKIFQLRSGVQLILTSGRGPPLENEMPVGVHFLPKPYDCQSLADLIMAA
jgi:two-component system, response regulator PdtaR